jgi:hypothetical protein
MTHYSNTSERLTTPREWLLVGSQIGQLVNTWAARNDLAVLVGPKTLAPAIASFHPDRAEVEINTAVAFGAVLPETVGDLNERLTQYEYPKVVGATMHEAMHARFTRWDLRSASEALSPLEFDALNLLEESRIEGLAVKLYPKNRIFLRASALELCLGDLTEVAERTSTVEYAANIAGLALARVDAGVLEEFDVDPIRDAIQAIIPTEKLERLQQIWLAAQDHMDHGNAAPLYEMAREWVRVLQDVAEERGEELTDNQQGEPGGAGSGGIPQAIKDLLEALNEAAENTTIANQGDIDDQETAEQWAEQVADKGKQAKQGREHKATAAEVFGKGTAPVDSDRTNSRLIKRRAPDSEERIAAVKVAQLLETAKYRDRSETEVKSILPPGRLRTRALVQGQALKSKGIAQQTEAWRRTMRKHTEDPTLTIGVMVDISGSMMDAMQPMASAAWIMSEATRRVQGKCAMVYYGQDVFPTLKPGHHQTEVQIYTAPDGTEKFDKAFKALDGSLNLLYGTGARLLVIVSDGCYTGEETLAAKKWMLECERQGIAVLWLAFDAAYDARRILAGTSGKLVNTAGSPTKAASEIGRAAADALTKIGRRQAA